MDNNEKIKIHVTLNGWRAPTMNISHAEEELYRIAERCFNDNLSHTMRKYNAQVDEALKLVAFNAILHFAKATDKYDKMVEQMQRWGDDADVILNEE